MERLEKYIKTNMVHVDELMLYDNETIKEFFSCNSYYTLDTESCDCNVTAHVYAWSIGNTDNDIQIYGEDINDIYSVFEKIARANVTKYDAKANTAIKFKTFVHNLTWDFEFFKYSLFEMGYQQYFGKVKFGNKTGYVQPGTFSVMENNNDIYSASIRLHNDMTFVSNRKNKQGEYKKQEIGIVVELIDSAKIMNKKLKDIAKDVIEIDEMFYKLDNYDYTTIREKGHKLTLEEKCYLYNDVYILKEFIKQFYMKLNTTKTTASSIAFESFLRKTFKQKSDHENYRIFKSIFPDLSGYLSISKMIDRSYRGGWTQANKKYIGKKLQLNNAVSIDINSSYPAVVKNCMLPFGEPLYFDGPIKDINEVRMLGYDMELLTIAFDAFANNDEDNLIGEMQVIETGNINDFSEIMTGINHNDYIHTNIIGGKRVGDRIIGSEIIGEHNATTKRKYTMTIWAFELENMLENMSFYIEEKKYNRNIGLWTGNGNLKKGYEIIETLSFPGRVGIFEEAVDYYTNEKIKSKKEGNKSMTEAAKLMLNSFYGKMGSNSDRVDRAMEINEDGMILFKGDAVHTYKTSKKYYKAFASAVTAWARVNLRTTLYKIGYNDVLYFDTDSLYTTITKDELVKRCGDILHATELGKWDHEKTYNEFKTIGAKKYMLTTTEGEIICKCAGLPDDARKLVTYETFEYNSEFEGKLSKVKIKGGYVLRTQKFTIKEK